MDPYPNPKERGQILVILVLALVALLAFTALAVDVGMAYSDRRYDQNVADSAALAGAEVAARAMIETDTPWENFNCNLAADVYVTSLDGWAAPEWLKAINTSTGKSWFESILDAAIGRAGTNKKTIGLGFDNQNGVAFHCESIDYVVYKENYVDIKVMVSGETPTSFAHFVFGGSLRNTVEAITRLTPRTPAGSGDSILAECSKTGDGLVYDGNVTIVTIKGHQFSNCDEKNTSNATIVQALDGVGGDCIVGGIGFYGEGDPGNENSCEAKQYNVQVPLPPVPIVTCPEAVDNPKLNKPPYELHPGTYSDLNINLQPDETLYMYPGLYCFDSNSKGNVESFKFTGGNIQAVDFFGKPITSPNGCVDRALCGITIWMISGNISITGNGTSILAAPANEPKNSATAGAVPGLLIGAPLNYTGRLNIEGTKGDTFIGTVYIPSGMIDIGGNKDINGDLTGPAFYTSLIADNIKFHGKAGVTVYYVEDQLYMVSAMMQMKK